MSYTDMSTAFFSACNDAALTLPIAQWVDWDTFQDCWTAGGEL